MRPQAILAPLLAILAAGCAGTSQKYVERTYAAPDADGWQSLESETKVKNRTIAPPFGSKAQSAHGFGVTVNEDGSYVLDMNSRGDLEGGDVSEALKAFADAAANLARLWAEIKSPVPLAMLEPLQDSP